MIPNTPESRQGFTLVELAIVLVIIGLIVGGVLVGRDMIRTTELRSVIQQFDQYKGAVYTFKGKYKAYPGDMRNATDYWPAAPVCDPDAVYSGDFSEGTCNGNGNKLIAGGVCGSTSRAGPCYEVTTFWQHLYYAELVKDFFAPDYALVTSAEELFPTVKFRVGWIWVPVNTSQLTGFFDTHQTMRNYFSSAVTITADSANIQPYEAHFIDEKMDDGRPATGSVTVLPGDITPNCTQNADGSETVAADVRAEYKVQDEGMNCILLMRYD